MPPEVPNYIEKAKLNDTTEKEKSILDSPDSFDEKEMRAFYKKKLDAAAGKTPLSAPLQQKYKEALQQIDENIKKFVDIRDYAKARMAILSEPIKFGDETVVQGGVESYLKKVPKIENVFDYFFHTKYLLDIDSLIKNPPKSLTAHLDFSIKDKAKFNKIRDDVAQHLETYYKGVIANGGKAEFEKIQTGVLSGKVSLIEYTDLGSRMDSLQDIVDDKAPGAKNQSETIMKLKEKITKMKSTLALAALFLPKADQLAVEAYNKALKARDNKEKGGSAAFEKASEYLYMIDNKQRADKNKSQLLAFGGDAVALVEGTGFYEKAGKIEKTNYRQANELYMKARDKYAESREIYLAEQQKKKSSKAA